MLGRDQDARRLFERVSGTANDLGLLAEEYDPKLRRQLGNFPQAFSHFALVNAAFMLAEGTPMVPGGAMTNGSRTGGNGAATRSS